MMKNFVDAGIHLVMIDIIGMGASSRETDFDHENMTAD
jgi:hypothetical protein